MKHFLAIAGFSVIAANIALPAQSQSAAEFYTGKTVSFGVGYPSGGFDTYTRAAARYMGKHIPGNPTVIVINMPGASSYNYVRHLQDRAPKDGTQFGMFDRGLIVKSVLDPKTTSVDFRQFTWIGSMNREVSACFVGNAKSITTVQDIANFKGNVVLGGTSKNGGGYVYTSLLQRMSPKNVKQVFGYESASQMVLATERGEIDGTCFIFGTLKINYPDLLEQKKLHMIVQYSESRSPDMPDVQTAYELARSDDEKQVINFLTSVDTVGRPIIAPQGLPADRVATLRKAFMDTMKDPEFLAFTAKAKMDIDPIDGEEAARIATQIVTTPANIVDLARSVLE